MTDLRHKTRGLVLLSWPYLPPPTPEEVTPPESIEDDGALVKLNASVQQLGGHDRGVAKTGRLAADFFTVEDDVFSVSSGEEDDRCCESPVHLYTH